VILRFNKNCLVAPPVEVRGLKKETRYILVHYDRFQALIKLL